jgi:hypothetical protein
MVSDLGKEWCQTYTFYKTVNSVGLTPITPTYCSLILPSWLTGKVI